MNIEFERTIDDFVELNLFHISYSPSLRRQSSIMRIIAAVLIFVILPSMIFIRVHYLPLIAYILGIVSSVIGYFVWPSIYRWSVIRQVRKMLKEGNNDPLLGHQEMSLSSEGIIYKTAGGESKLNWSSVDKVLQNDKYIYIYIGAVNAYIVPKNAFTSNRQQKEFLDYVSSNVGQLSKAS